VAFASLAFAAFAPVGLCLVPLGALLAVSRPRTRSEILVAALICGLALLWLLQPGEPPDQLARTVAVIGGATFVLASVYSRSSVTHRALLAVTASAVAVALLFPLLGWNWDAIRWWVEHRTGFAVRLALGQLVAAGASGSGATSVSEIERWFESGVRVLADQYAAMLAVQLLAGLALAAAIYYRAHRRPWGTPPGRFRDFRFSEHLGWVGAVALVVVLIPRLAVAKGAALNLLVVTGLLYGLRGLAVTAFGIALLGGAGCGTAALFALLALFVLPAGLAGAIVLGVVDAGLDLRKRWVTPRG
jgi:hypothetical protein